MVPPFWDIAPCLAIRCTLVSGPVDEGDMFLELSVRIRTAPEDGSVVYHTSNNETVLL
jgi:hypothetical protein